jgi:Transposase DDE domain
MDFGPDKTGVPGLAGDTETILRRCIDQGLVGGESFAVDASLIKADANRQKGIEGEKGLPPEAAGHAIEEYLAVLDDAAFGAATEIVPKFISPADPAARWTGAHGGQAFFAYSTNYLIDVEHAIIVDVEATPARTYDEVTKTMIERTEQRLDLKPDWLTADTAYGTGKFLHGCRAKASRRISPCGNDIHRLMACSPVANSPTTLSKTSISVPMASSCEPPERSMIAASGTTIAVGRSIRQLAQGLGRRHRQQVGRCPPIGQTGRGEMVYSLDCKAIKAESANAEYKPKMPPTTMSETVIPKSGATQKPEDTPTTGVNK